MTLILFSSFDWSKTKLSKLLSAKQAISTVGGIAEITWVGLSDPGGMNSWVWNDNTNLRLDSDMWAANEPDNNGGTQEDCGFVLDAGLGDRACHFPSKFLCQIRGKYS